MSEEIKDIQAKPISASQTSSYRSIFKATSLFGGVQVYQIVIQIIRSKFVAVLLGASGVGIQGLFTSATEMIKNVTSMGLAQSAVKDVSIANASGNKDRIQTVLSVLHRLVIVTGLLGMLTVILLSPILSKSSFGDHTYTVAFLFLSLTLLFDQICAGQKVVLQGMRRLQDLAKASAIGVTIGLIVSIPLLYIWGVKGIVPTLIISSLAAMLLTWYYSNKVGIKDRSVSRQQVLSEGTAMLKLGIAMSVSGILTSACTYILRSYIRLQAGTEFVGLYIAGYAIINTYVGMVFTAIGTDYYPRLASVTNDREQSLRVINQQGEIGMLILAPLLAICCLIMPVMIRLLYSSSFLPANDYIIWATIGMAFRLIAVLVAYQFIVKGDTKRYIINEVISNGYILLMNIVGFKISGLSGLGIAFLVSCIFYFIQVCLVTRHFYGFKFDYALIRVFGIHLLLLIGIILCIKLLPVRIGYVIGGIIAAGEIVLALKMLNERIDIKGVIYHIIKRS